MFCFYSPVATDLSAGRGEPHRAVSQVSIRLDSKLQQENLGPFLSGGKEVILRAVAPVFLVGAGLK